jgi:uncharacterized membrane protein
METYLLLRLLHIVSATVLLGTGLGIAFFMAMAHRSGQPALIAATSRWVVIADGAFTAPAVLVQAGSGTALVILTGIPWQQPWLVWALALFVFVGACWLPVVWIQWRVSRIAAEAVAQGRALGADYRRLMRWWFALGWPAFAAVLAIFWLMVRKPLLAWP